MRRPKFKSLRKFEVLEDRWMMAGDISYSSSNHILTINGAGYDDVAQVRFEGSRVYVDLIAGESGGGTDHHDFDKKISDVSKIVFNGLAGNDTLTVVNNQLNSGVTLDNVQLEFHGDNGDDHLFSPLQGGVRTVAFGGFGNDTLQGSRYDDILEGGSGDDDLSGGSGNDKYVFSGIIPLGDDAILNEAANVGSDTLDFTNFGQSVWVVLPNVYNPNNPEYAVTTKSYTAPADSNLKVRLYDNTAIENVIGTAYNDYVRGNSRPNYISGRGGEDVIFGAGGDDTLDGGTGSDTYVFNDDEFLGSNLGTDSIVERANADSDTLDFACMSYGLTVDLTKFGTNYAVNTANLKLRLANDTAIENVVGSYYNDKIIGNSRDNGIMGIAGNDVITGGAGTDCLQGGEGDDKLYTDALDQVYGGMGKDWFDEYYEATPQLTNPRPGRYMDWKVA